MIVWVGDNNLLLTLPFYFVLLFFCTQGDWQARLVVPACLFCIAMSLNALIDSASRLYSPHDFVSTLLRCLAWLLLYLVARRFFGRPASSLSLSPRLWWIALGLTVAPLSALITVVLVNGYNDTQVGLVQAALILPFVLLSALAILFSLVQLSRQWALEQEHQLASMREVYYQGIQREQQQVRRLRHDMANHWTALCGFFGDRADSAGPGLSAKPAIRLPQHPALLCQPGGRHRAFGQGGRRRAGGGLCGLAGGAAGRPACCRSGPVRPAGQCAGQRH